MNMGLTVPKCVLIVWLKIPKMHQNLFAKFVYQTMILNFNEKSIIERL